MSKQTPARKSFSRPDAHSTQSNCRVWGGERGQHSQWGPEEVLIRQRKRKRSIRIYIYRIASDCGDTNAWHFDMFTVCTNNALAERIHKCSYKSTHEWRRLMHQYDTSASRPSWPRPSAKQDTISIILAFLYYTNRRNGKRVSTCHLCYPVTLHAARWCMSRVIVVILCVCVCCRVYGLLLAMLMACIVFVGLLCCLCDLMTDSVAYQCVNIQKHI